MTTTKRFTLLGLLGGLALLLTVAAEAGHGRPRNKYSLNELNICGGKDFSGWVVCDGDCAMALPIRKSDNKLGYLHNFKHLEDELWVDNRYLGYDLRGKNKNVLVPEKSGEDTRWEFVHSTDSKERFRARHTSEERQVERLVDRDGGS